MKKLIIVVTALLVMPSIAFAGKGGKTPAIVDLEAAVEEIKIELCNHYALTGDPIPSICKDFCSDGIKESFEECDDGNTEIGDGCDAECFIEEECQVNADCPEVYQPYCSDPASCQGYATVSQCIGSKCEEVVIDDDSACNESTLACGADIYCNGTPEQEAPTCP